MDHTSRPSPAGKLFKPQVFPGPQAPSRQRRQPGKPGRPPGAAQTGPGGRNSAARRPAYPPVARPQPQRLRAQRPRGASLRDHPLLSELKQALLAPQFVGVLVSAVLVGLVLLGLGLFLSFTYYQSSDRVLPGVQVGSQSLSGRRLADAALLLEKSWNQQRTISITEGMHTWQIPPAQLGLRLDALATARSAYELGRQGGTLERLQATLHLLQQGASLEPVVLFDPVAARIGLERLTPAASLPAQNARLEVQSGQLVEAPGSIGYTINLEETLAHLSQDPRSVLVKGAFQVSLKPVLPDVQDVSSAKAEAERLLAAPLSIRAYDPISDEHLEWNLPQEQRLEWLRVQNDASGPRVWLDESALPAYVDSLSQSLGPERYLEVDPAIFAGEDLLQSGQLPTLRIRHNPTLYTVGSGDTLIRIGWKTGIPYWRILQANPGLNPDKLVPGQQINLPSQDDLLPLPPVENKRIVISISQQRLWTYQDGAQLAEYVISTGMDRSPTQPGVFQVQTHERSAYASIWDLTMPNFMGIYEAWPGFMNGLHGLPTLSNGRRLWANVLGRPASYGCIILDLDAAEQLFNWAEDGVVVEIRE